jgi:hypothetical protein
VCARCFFNKRHSHTHTHTHTHKRAHRYSLFESFELSAHRQIQVFSSGKVSFDVEILNPPIKSTNTWSFCIGVVPLVFQANSSQKWIGSQHSWVHWQYLNPEWFGSLK